MPVCTCLCAGLSEADADAVLEALREARLLDQAGALCLEAETPTFDAALSSVDCYHGATVATKAYIQRALRRSCYVRTYLLTYLLTYVRTYIQRPPSQSLRTYVLTYLRTYLLTYLQRSSPQSSYLLTYTLRSPLGTYLRSSPQSCYAQVNLWGS